MQTLSLTSPNLDGGVFEAKSLHLGRRGGLPHLVYVAASVCNGFTCCRVKLRGGYWYTQRRQINTHLNKIVVLPAEKALWREGPNGKIVVAALVPFSKAHSRQALRFASAQLLV